MTELLTMSAYAAPLIAVTIILRALLINRLPKRTFLILWAIVLCRLLVPITLPSPVSVYSLAQRLPMPEATAPIITPVTEPASEITQGAVSASETTQGLALPQAQQTTAYMATASTQTEPVTVPEQNSKTNTLSLQTLLPILWVVGFTGCAGFFIITHLRCRRVYRTALPIKDDYAAEWLLASSFRRTVRVRQSDQILAPLTYGVWRPVVLLPKSLEGGGENRLSYVLVHEGEHIRRFDVLWKWLLAWAVCVHWFNPLVWAMYILANRDIELCCDESVVRSFGETVKSAYALALIGLEETRSRFMPLCNNFSKTAIEERIVSIMKYKKTTLTAILLAVVMIIGTTASFAFGAAESSPKAAVAVNQGTTDVASAEYTAPDYSKYKPFGVTYDATVDRLYYEGQLIRCFDDEYPIGDAGTAGISHFTAEGVIDVHTVRELSQLVRNADGSYDPSGVLVGVKPYSQAEFEARRLDTQRYDGSTTAINATAYESTPISPDELAKEYSVYEPFGITYDMQNDLLYYRGKLIYYFLDVMSSNGEDFSGGKFQGAMRSKIQEYGGISVQVIRDYNEPDADGFGKIVGIEAIVEEQYSFNKEADSLRESIAPYSWYGLTLDAATNTMWYGGKQVRQLFDSVTGILVTSSLNNSYPKDAIDVEPVYENGVLTGLRQATQAEYDQHTQERQQPRQDTMSGESYGTDQTFSDIEWWTAEEYAVWLAQEKVDLQSIIGERAWNNKDGWFIWTQEKVDEAIRMYEQILEDIIRGAKVSKPFGDTGSVLIQDISQDTAIASVEEGVMAVSVSTGEIIISSQDTVLPASEYTAKAWALTASDYNDLLENITLRTQNAQVYLCKGVITEILAENPQFAIMDTSTDGNEQLVLLQNESSTQWELGKTYRVYADVSGLYGSIPWLNGRYTFE